MTDHDEMTRRTLLASGGAAALALPSALGAATRVPAPRTLSNPKASARAVRLYRYLWSVYGKATLTGQQELNRGARGATVELDFIERASGKLPAILGLDYIDPDDQTGVTNRATRWYLKQGGIPSICWHWGAPDIGTGYENSKKDFDVAAALRPGTPQNKAMTRDLVQVADQLTVLRDRGVPVLWRPFHEFTGTWFWWGKHGADGFKALWIMMYDYFMRERGLNNLIWVLGYTVNVDPAYYPGRQYVDIAGADNYIKDHGNQAEMFQAVKRLVGDTVPICLHENGPIPDPDQLAPSADWLWFLTWHSGFIMDGVANSSAEIDRFFNARRYITKDEVPKLF